MAKLLKTDIHDLGDFTVGRVLPNMQKKMIGPFIFFDHIGPATFPAGKGVNVRPHPHIGLATISYLLEGSLLHQDSLGFKQEILPGDVNWMTAGKGIVHSERETMEVRSREHNLHGLQVWIALPEDRAEIDPSFTHIKKEDLPNIYREKVMMRLIVGDAYGKASPVKVHSPMFYLDVIAEKGAKFERPCGEQETGVFIIDGQLKIGNDTFSEKQFVLLEDEQEIEVKANSRFFLLGGQKWDKTPHLNWNFVSFDRERINQAREDWKNGRFAKVPTDDNEFIPLPEK